MAARSKEQQRSESARGRFFVRVGQTGQATHRCENTLPLFPLWLILDADRTLAPELAQLVERTHA